MRIRRKRSAKGNISYVMTIPMAYAELLGEPYEADVDVYGHMLGVIPVYDIDIGVIDGDELEATVSDLGREAARVGPGGIVGLVGGVEVFLRLAVLANEGINTLVVDCRRGLTEHYALMLFGNGRVWRIGEGEGWLACGYTGIGAGRLARLVSWLSGRGWTIGDRSSAAVEAAIKDPSTRAVVVDFILNERKMRVRVYRGSNT